MSKRCRIAELDADNPNEVRRIGTNARSEARELKKPARSIAAFQALWTSEIQKPKRRPVFAPALRATPSDWYHALNVADFPADGDNLQTAKAASKGSLAHLLGYYPGLDRPQRRPIASFG
ncbi:MAG: hypothetical protein ACSHXI_02875 [Hoeflea sp.]|uniref:hypothetical protein n=1 Tax=Hoeflea sp. TaxID=1940281 RepID=UPI003EF8CF0C